MTMCIIGLRITSYDHVCNWPKDNVVRPLCNWPKNNVV